MRGQTEGEGSQARMHDLKGHQPYKIGAGSQVQHLAFLVRGESAEMKATMYSLGAILSDALATEFVQLRSNAVRA